MIERILLPIDFENVFISIPLNVSDIELKEDSDTNKSKNFNINIQTYLTSKGKYEEFTVIKINFNIVKKDDEEYPNNEDDFYVKPNNIKYYNIIQMNYIYNYCALHLRFKTINNFFFKPIFKLIKKVYKKEEIRHQIFTIRTTIYRTFISSLEYPP